MLRLRTSLGICLTGLLLGCGDATEISGTPVDPLGGGSQPGSGSPDRCTTASYHAEQGRQLQGSRGSSFTIASVSLGCGSVQNLRVEGAQLLGTNQGAPVSGADFLGGIVNLRDADGQPATARIANVERDAGDPTGATFLYTLTYQDPNTGATINACLPDPTGVSAALPLRGRWDATGAKQDRDTAISLGCTSGVLAKCVRWGYRPWESKNGVLLENHHQACTRMARADYCGNGTSYTLDGTEVDIYDRVPVLTRNPALLSLFESTWTPDGAYCIARERWLSIIGLLPPNCSVKFELAIESNPVDINDLCLMKRRGILAADALVSNSTGINIKL